MALRIFSNKYLMYRYSVKDLLILHVYFKLTSTFPLGFFFIGEVPITAVDVDGLSIIINKK